jgi:signal transduction histidine kinase
VLVKDELPSKNWLKVMESEDVSLILRLGTKNKLTGLYLCGPKQNGRIYNRQDIDFMSVGAKNLGIAIENAKKFNQITKFADTMHHEVVKATIGLRKANKELKTLDVLKDDFISMASHQLRSPATSVHEAIQMMVNEEMPESEKDQLLRLADASCERLVGVIQDMLSVAKIQAGHFVINKSEVDIVELVNRGILEASAQTKQKNIKINFIKPSKPILIMADRAKLNESISNYIENAIRYSPPESTIDTEIKILDGKIHFQVSDSGIGVPAEERGNLFSKYYRAENARNVEPNGNGIGLFVVKEIIEALGGEAYYKPLEQGSMFGFWLDL